MASFQKTMREVEALCAELNRLTNRPSRAYEPSDEPYPPANIGYIYVRNLGEQDRNRCSLGAIFNHGGGLVQIHGLTYLPIGDLLRVLKARMADPEWMARMMFEIQRPFEGSLEVVTAPERGTCDLLLNGDKLLASHPNGGSCRVLAERLQQDPRRALAQAEYIVACGGSADLDAIRTLVSGATAVCDRGACTLTPGEDPEEDDNECSNCGDPTDDGESYDGLCGPCADRAVGAAAKRGMAANPKPTNPDA